MSFRLWIVWFSFWIRWFRDGLGFGGLGLGLGLNDWMNWMV